MHQANRQPVQPTANALTRRAFLGTAATATVAASVPAAVPRSDWNCIFLVLTGGPSQLETFDPKPDAPAEVRGPFNSGATRIPGVRLGEHLPRLATLAHRFALVRSVQHTAAAVHETGLQLLQTGRLSGRIPAPHVGAIVGQRLGTRRPGMPPFVILPGVLGNMGLGVAHGQEPAAVSATLVPPATAKERDQYGRSAFGENCRRACRLVEAGTRFVVVNMFTSLSEGVTWDCHADRRGFVATLDDYRRTLCPAFDQACAALIDDLHQRGLLDQTLVVAAGEMGRTPQLNAFGGRDHWPGAWSVLFAGGGIRGGQVIGATDKWASEPVRDAVRAEDVAATVLRAFGINNGGRPIERLFG